MKIRKAIFCLLITLGWSFHLGAFCSFRLFKAPNGKWVLLIGDLHDRGGRFQEHVSSFIDTLELEKLSPPLEIIAELPEKLPGDGEYDLVPSFVQLCALKKRAESQRGTSFQFTCCEPRGQASAELGTLRSDLSKIVREVVTQEDYKKLLDKDLPGSQTGKSWAEVKARELTQLRKDRMDQRLTHPEVTLKQYIRALSQYLNQIEIIRDRHREVPALYELFESQYRSRYVEACQAVKESLQGYSPENYLYYILFEDHPSAERPIELLTKFIVFDAHVLDSTDNLFATAVMLDYILSRSSTMAPTLYDCGRNPCS